MTKIVRVRVETAPDYKIVAETPDFCMGVAQMQYICTGVVETLPDGNRIVVTPSLAHKRQSGKITMSQV